MPSVLAIETSAEACSVALFCGSDFRLFHEQAPQRHAELLLPAVRELLSTAGFGLAELDAIAFGRGPGSFTSLRIGIGVVQGLAWASGIPVVPVSSLAAVAQSAAGMSGLARPRIRVALDARMQEIYTGDYRPGRDGLVKLLGAERVCAPAAIEDRASGPFIVAGNGFERFDELKSMGQEAEEAYPHLAPGAEMIGRLALGWLESNEALPAAQAQPVYLRNKVAEKPGAETRAQGREA